MNQRVKKWLTFVLRWGIAVVGIWWVISQITWRDRVTTLDAQNRPVVERLADNQPLNGGSFTLLDGRVLPAGALSSLPDAKQVTLASAPRGPKAELLALDLTPDLKKVNRLLVAPMPGGPGEWVTPGAVVGYRLKVPHPLVEIGVGRMLRDAASGHKPWLLILAMVIFPITFIVTSFRWHQLLKALEINLTLARTFVLNMVGAFYNTFMPGSTGGDVLKAYYASKHTTHRTRAVMSVFIDRVIGLIALVILGGTMATIQYFIGGADDPASHACGKIALVSALIVLGTVIGLWVFYHPKLRRITGLDWIISKLPKQKQVKNAMQTMELYRKHKGLVFQALIATFPVHVTVVLSAMLAGWAFGLKISTVYYFVAVPVIVLVGSIPISPQGAGVMEYFAILLLGRQGATVSEAFALTMSIRMVQILWNLTGGIFVFRGGYHQPTEAEQRDLGEPDPPPAAMQAA
jgi:glycosyltransferase 2 family protein